MSVVFSILAAGLVVVTWPSDDWIRELTALRVDRVAPHAVLTKRQEEGQSVGISFYRIASEQSGRSWAWRVRYEDKGHDLSGRVRWAEQEDCAAMTDALSVIELMPLPRIELRASDPRSRRLPVMGPLHLTHQIWVRATDADNSPIWLTMSALGAGEPQRIYEQVHELLKPCWKDDALQQQ